jgi:hypothetical protein
MRYHISRNGEVIGIHEFQEVLSGINHGTFLRTDYYWKEGNEPTEWILMSEFKVNEIKREYLVSVPKSRSWAKALISQIRNVWRMAIDKLRTANFLTVSHNAEKTSYQIAGCVGAAFIVFGSILPFFTRTVSSGVYYVGALSLSLLQFSMTSTIFLITLNLLYIYFYFFRPVMKAMNVITIITTGIFCVVLVRNFSYNVKQFFVSLFSSKHYETLSDALTGSWGPKGDYDKVITDHIEVGGLLLITGVALSLYAVIKSWTRRPRLPLG